MEKLYTIRPMTAEDVPAVQKIEGESFTDPWSETAFAQTLGQDNTRLFVSVQEGEITGYCVFYMVCDEADLERIAVREDFRGRGIAETLLREAIAALTAEHITSMTLEVRVSNTPAIGLYEKLGFVNEGIRPGFYEKPKEDAAIMWLRKMA